jgi:rhamnogalacturonyl hydrolase YesR
MKQKYLTRRYPFLRVVFFLILLGISIPVFIIGKTRGESLVVYNPEGIVDANLRFAALQLDQMIAQLDTPSLLPRSVNDGELRLVKSSDWTSGFFPGNLWYMYEYTRDEKWKESAESFTALIEKEKYNGRTHDMGFKLMCSYGNAYRLTKNPLYKSILLTGAETLMTRYHPTVGAIRSWDHNDDKWDYPVIIDNMMNLELLYLAFRETRDSSFYYAANSHAEITLKNHFREDNSSYHVVSFDTITGDVMKKNTHQGYSDESAWARGQAWGLYGFTMVYRETGDKQFLDQAMRIAAYILEHENYPADGVPYWDFNDPNIPDSPRDVSAAAIICSALYELSLYVDSSERKVYFDSADRILKFLSGDKYLAQQQEYSGFILDHSVGHLPKDDEIDGPIIYADYYYLEANLRRMKINGNWKGEKASVIIKADDLTFDSEKVVNSRWQTFADLAVAYEIKVAPGIIGSSLELGDKAFFDWIENYRKTGLFEFWNHGQLHKRWEVEGVRTSEFFNLDKEAQMAYISQTQKLGREKLGYDFVTFAAPYNWSDEHTALALEEFPEIKVWLYKPENLESTKIALPGEAMLNIEYPVHNASFYHFFNSYYFYSNQDVIVIQGHPKSWDEHRMEQFELFARYFNEAGIKTLLPSELAASIME